MVLDLSKREFVLGRPLVFAFFLFMLVMCFLGKEIQSSSYVNGVVIRRKSESAEIVGPDRPHHVANRRVHLFARTGRVGGGMKTDKLRLINHTSSGGGIRSPTHRRHYRIHPGNSG